MFYVIFLMIAIFFIWRNLKVYSFLTELLEKIYALSMEDIEIGGNPFWRWHVFHQVTYGEMVAKFWLSLCPESFWKDTSFLQSSEKSVQRKKESKLINKKRKERNFYD